MEKLLLHSCCGPCSTAVIERLLADTDFDITIYYYNPCIAPEDEYFHRKAEQIRVIKSVNSPRVKFLDCDYNPREYLDAVRGFEGEPEGGARCTRCFALRLKKTAEMAKAGGFDVFGTTLTVSPHKNAKVINSLGAQIAGDAGVSFLEADFKKKDGFKRSIVLSKQLGLYRQDYCGCIFSKRKEKEI